MRASHILLLILLFITAHSIAQTGTIQGKIIDVENKEPIPFATLMLGSHAYYTASNLDGDFTFKNIPAGKYRVLALYIGYDSAFAYVEVKADQTSTCTIKMKQATITLDEAVIVSYDAPLIDASTRSYYTITRESKSMFRKKGKRMRGSRNGLNGMGGQSIRAGLLTAGRKDDIKDRNEWYSLLKKEEGKENTTYWRFFPDKQFRVLVTDGLSALADIPVTLEGSNGEVIWKARTNNKGEAILYAGLFGEQPSSYSIAVMANGQIIREKDVQPNASKPLKMVMSKAASLDNTDILFMIDATGSMGDELEYLKTELKDVINRSKPGEKTNVRFSCNVYRDQGDDYVVRNFAFSNNIDDVLANLSGQSAAGGGDYEEAVEQALDSAINGHSWSSQARARLLFLVLDAPPHYTEENIAKLHLLTKQAAEKGIRIIPVASSGVDKHTEYLLRFLSASTGGKYVFLTDHSGIGNPHLLPSIKKFKVEYLNNVLTDIIRQYTR